MEGGIRHHDSHDDCNMPMELDTVELERKLLVHVLSKRLTKVERYGLLAGHGKADAWRPRERARGHARTQWHHNARHQRERPRQAGDQPRTR